MIYFQNAFSTVSWDEASSFAVCTTVGFVDGEELRRASESVLTLLRDKRAKKLLSNTKDMKVLTQEDQQWITTDWFPRMVAAGLRCIALVVPTSALAKMSLKFVLTKVSGFDVVVNHFDEEEQAREWLRAQR